MGALRSTESLGSWPESSWGVYLHTDDESFEAETQAPPARFAVWIGSVLHLRPWHRLLKRDLGGLLRHEMAHRRLRVLGLRPWEEEARCLWAENHNHAPSQWPKLPSNQLQDQLDRALQRGTTRRQAWAYAWLRAWLEGRPLPQPPGSKAPREEGWKSESRSGTQWQDSPWMTVRWPGERLPRDLVINEKRYSVRHGTSHHFSGSLRLEAPSPVLHLEGEVQLQPTPQGWSLIWLLTQRTWVAAATDGELGTDASFEAKRALAAVLKLWVQNWPRGKHRDGSFCPLTHCAVVRGQPSQKALEAVDQAPTLDLDPRWAFYTGSKGGVNLSPQEIWGSGPNEKGGSALVPGDRWARWERTLEASQLKALISKVPPGLKPGQKGLCLGPSGPYPVEKLRLEAGRLFGWTIWPSNACEAELQADGRLSLRGRGWGHNTGLCLATAIYRASQGWKAEDILAEAFPGACEGTARSSDQESFQE